MDVISPLYLDKIRKITSVFIFICCLAGLIGNLFIKGTLFNIILLLSVSGIFLITIHLKKYLMAVYIIQVATFILVGFITIFLGEESHYIGDMLILAGILLAYTYRLIKSYSYYKIILIIIVMAVVKSISRSGDIASIITTIVSSTMILFMWALFKNELNQYIRESQKNESLARIGMNAGNFLHNLHLATAIKLINGTIRYSHNGNPEKLNEYLQRLASWADDKKEMRNKIVKAIKSNKTEDAEPVDIHETIQSVIETLYFDEEVFQRIQIKRDFVQTNIFINAVPFEIYFILQNILINAVEAMLKIKFHQQHLLTIKTIIQSKKLIIIIHDTGPGFPVTKKGEINLKSSKPTGGYGTKYIISLIRNYQGHVDFSNAEQGGAIVTLQFPHEGSRIKIEFPKEKKNTDEFIETENINC